MKVKKILTYVAPVLVLGGGVAAFAVLHAVKPEPEKVEEVARPVSVFVETVRREPVTLTVASQGEVEPRVEIDLIPQVSGKVIYVAPNFIEGGIFKAGETLVRIEDADYRQAVTRAEAAVAAAELELARQEASAEIVAKQWQWERLEKEEPTALGLRKPQVAEARARLRAAEADLESARRNLQRTRIAAPFSGHVRAKDTDIGAVVSVGTKLGRIFSTEVVEIRLALTDAHMGMLGLPVAYNAPKGDGPKVNLTATVGGEIRHWNGRISRTDAAIDKATRLFYAIAEVSDPYGAGAANGTPLPVGLFVSAEIEGRTLDEAFVLPRAALRPNDQVYVVTTESLLDIRTVNVISASADRVVLRDGVKEGEMVVTSPVPTPKNGLKVEPARREEAALLATLNGTQAGGGQ